MRQMVPVAAWAALVISVGIVHGFWTNRWWNSRELDEAVARLDRVPTEFGTWKSRPIPVDPREMAEARIEGFLARRYENRWNKTAVSVLLMCGRPGPLSVHTPDICYKGLGFQLAGAPARCTLPSDGSGKTCEFMKVGLLKPNTLPPRRMTIYWAWNASGAWKAPDNPRLTFGSFPVIYKLYLVQERGESEDESEEGVPSEFISQFLRGLDKTLFASP